MEDKKRLLDIVNILDSDKKIIDVGTDHGLVPLYLAKNKISSDITATDISKPSLQKLVDKLDDDLRKVIKTKVTDESHILSFNFVRMVSSLNALRSSSSFSALFRSSHNFKTVSLFE